MSYLWNLFFPHHANNHKAVLIKTPFLFLFCLVFVFLQAFLNFFLLTKPSVLGFSSNISPESIIELTNVERQKLGLSPLTENKLLSEAARQKAADMFAFNYWAHVSPSGRTPWVFFTDVGYKYQFAGENLARDFRDSPSVIQAWMNSPAHRDNVLNSKYKEIGIAVVDGTLQGAETTLVIQLFGTPYGVLDEKKAPESKPVVEERPVELPREAFAEEKSPEVMSLIPNSSTSKTPVANPLDLTKIMAILTVGVLLVVFAIDFFLVSRRQTPRLSSKSMAQMMFLAFVLIIGLLIKRGAIL